MNFTENCDRISLCNNMRSEISSTNGLSEKINDERIINKFVVAII